MATKLEDYCVMQDGKRLRYGYTTGSCATAATKAAAMMLLSGKTVDAVSLTTPFGILLQLEVLDITCTEQSVTCAIQKDAGDDPDVTHGMLIYATVSKNDQHVHQIEGGVGVGRVTRVGLEQPIGSPAINQTPRAMMRQQMQTVCEEYGYQGGLTTVIEMPAGQAIAQKTFNPKLGIEGGLSVLGTSGIVVPMSKDALIKTIEVEMKMRMAQGDRTLLLTPGNYGENFLKAHLDLPFEKNIKCSNYVGNALQFGVQHGATGMLFVAHIGKFIKIAGGIMDTHSRMADCRAELMASSAVRAGADLSLTRAILDTVTTDQALALLQQHDLLAATMAEVLTRIDVVLNRNVGQMTVGAVLFSNQFGYLGKTRSVDTLTKQLNEEK